MTSWTVAHQAPLYMGFSRQEYRNGLLCPPPGDLPNRGIKPRSPALQEDSLPSEPPGKPINGIVFPISFSDSSLLVYRKIANFYIFTLYPATLPNSFISSNNFLLLETLGFSSVICCHCCSVSQSRTTLCNPMDCSMPGFPVLHCLLEVAQTYVH